MKTIASNPLSLVIAFLAYIASLFLPAIKAPNVEKLIFESQNSFWIIQHNWLLYGALVLVLVLNILAIAMKKQEYLAALILSISYFWLILILIQEYGSLWISLPQIAVGFIVSTIIAGIICSLLVLRTKQLN